MLELQTKIKRQIELVGLSCAQKTTPQLGDLAMEYDCEELTIKRDLGDLRSHGIDVHSERRKGVRIVQPLKPAQIRNLIVQYLGICSANNNVDKATALLVRRHKSYALQMVVLLQRNIEAHRIVRVDYEKEAGELERDRWIGPLLIFQSEGFWRLLAIHEGVPKQYHLNKLRNVRGTDKRFEPIPEERITDMFRFSFRSWIGSERHEVRLRLDAVWANRIKPQQLMDSQVIIDEGDATVILETTVNSLEEIASWVVSRGEGVTVLAPEALRKRVIELARGALRNYEGGA